ncbi:MAG: DUF523 domain-containing protein [Campylobacterales bacterium]|nr:DUF523 domain-containing protein [Campylobacterales bacterium]
MEKEKLLISSCFLGNLVKYNGDHNRFSNAILEKLEAKYHFIAVCPEVDGGLPTPRVPCEIVSSSPLQVLDKEGVDKTQEFVKGAQIAYKIVKQNNIKKALLKANSPSCSSYQINDGTFAKKRIISDGVAVRYLRELKIEIFDETQIDQLL